MGKEEKENEKERPEARGRGVGDRDRREGEGGGISKRTERMERCQNEEERKKEGRSRERRRGDESTIWAKASWFMTAMPPLRPIASAEFHETNLYL